MSVLVLNVRFAGLSVVVSMDRERRRREDDRLAAPRQLTSGADLLFERYPAIARDTDAGLKLRS
jgi:hypothetical protein